MSRIAELQALTVKDLRQLAGEHSIKNRSRLAKEQLVSALQQAIGNRQPAQAKQNRAAQVKAEQQTAAAESATQQASMRLKSQKATPENVVAATPVKAGKAVKNVRHHLQNQLDAESSGSSDTVDRVENAESAEEPSDQPDKPRRRRRRGGRGRNKKNR